MIYQNKKSLSNPLPFKSHHIALFVLLMAGSLIPIWSTTFFPSQNSPRFILVVQMFKELVNPEFNYSDYFQYNIRIIPHSTHIILVYIFSFFFPLLTAHQLALSVYALMLPLSVVYFLKITSPSNMGYGLISFLFIFNYNLVRGYHELCLSIPAFFFAFSYWLKHSKNLSYIHIVTLNILVFLIYLSHMFAFMLFALVVFIYVFFEKNIIKRILQLIWFILPTSILCIIYFFYSKREAVKYFSEDAVYLPFHTNLENILRKFFYTFSLWEQITASIPIVIIFMLIGKKMITMYKTYRKNYPIIGILRENRLLILTLILIALYFIIPYEVLGWHKVNIRILPFAFIFALASAQKIESRKAYSFFLIGIFILIIIYYSIMYRHIYKYGAEVESYVTEMLTLKKNKLTGQVKIEDFSLGEINPYAWCYEYYNVFKGGASSRSVAEFKTIVPIIYKKYPIEPYLPTFDKRNVLKSLTRMTEVYDYIFVWGHNDQIKEVLERYGYKLIRSKNNLWIFSSPSNES